VRSAVQANMPGSRAAWQQQAPVRYHFICCCGCGREQPKEVWVQLWKEFRLGQIKRVLEKSWLCEMCPAGATA